MTVEYVLTAVVLVIGTAAAVRLMLVAQRLTVRESEIAAEQLELEDWERELILAAEGRGCAACRLRVCSCGSD